MTRSNPHAWFLTDLINIPKNGIKVMSTFACGGGSTMGYKLAGCDVIAANDIDHEMAWHYKKNLNPKLFFECAIKELITKELPHSLFELDILDGSPPCSTFSMAGSRENAWGKEKHFREGQAKQVLSDLFFDFIDLAERLKPKVIIAENVKGMLIGNAKGYTKLVVHRLKEIGYKPQVFLLNAADCGVPQRRERVFFCALRNDISKPQLVLKPLNKLISAGEATNDLQDLTNDEIQNTQVTESARFQWRNVNNFTGIYSKPDGKSGIFYAVKVIKNFPSRTLPAHSSNFMHWSECRKLTFREWKRLGSFPDDYIAKSDNIGKYIIGMSVPPKMMEYVAKEVCKQWLN